MYLLTLDALKDLVARNRHNALVRSIANHTVRLAGTRLPIREEAVTWRGGGMGKAMRRGREQYERKKENGKEGREGNELMPNWVQANARAHNILGDGVGRYQELKPWYALFRTP